MDNKLKSLLDNYEILYQEGLDKLETILILKRIEDDIYSIAQQIGLFKLPKEHYSLYLARYELDIEHIIFKRFK